MLPKLHTNAKPISRVLTSATTSTFPRPLALPPLPDATVSDCGTSSTHTKFKALSVSPNPPVKGKLATVTASGSLDESVSKAGYSFAVSLDGNELYTHSGDACGTDVINLPLNMGKAMALCLLCSLC